MNTRFRHGDVVLEEISDMPEDCSKVDHTNTDGIILAEGEKTGHRHRVDTKDGELYSVPKRDWRILVLKKPAKLFHEEHKTITLPAGKYRVHIKRQYTPDGWVNVAD